MSTPGSAAFDEEMMAIALTMARRGLGSTAPNPSVGALVVDERTGEIIARGTTQRGGRPHAETEALARAGERARGVTIYVTLEPCSHFGRTPPCADAIVAAGISRAVVAMEDPDPRVAGRGLERLRKAGISVTRGILTEPARQVTRGHVLRLTERRPLVQVKVATDAEGRIARGQAGRPAWVTSEEARARGHLLRAQADAIMVGAGTVADDDPDLTCRLPGLADLSPIRVIASTHARNLLDTRLLKTAGDPPVWVVAGFQAAEADTGAIESRGARVLRAATVAGTLWLPSALEQLAGEGITRLLVEGGPRLWRSLSDAGLIDEIAWFRAGGQPGDLSPLARWLDVEQFVAVDEASHRDTGLLFLRRSAHIRPAAP
jgi:diaminohydroxyphosphoribosylaminopyrimidine deaminase/5-amino-6-(5-phosphoribosylamino)uracil reductase